ncbi:murein hydrolase activator EnvC family protein [Flavonifractor sp. An4]|uniref:murein hydrolase activator EnvC family protein n=1 Tax=Flavonifractor sp. An4 TaxID=1965634 RepID=UPI001FA82B6E|nr:M23 family metallopeptidase [Flavonifractor sp. An4]
MAKSGKKTNQKNSTKKVEPRRVVVGVLAAVLALLMLLPMVSMIISSAGAVTQSEIDALKKEQEESQAKQDALKDQLADLEVDQAAAQEKRQLLTEQLNAINAEIANIDAQISYYDGEIAQKEEERKEAEAREAEQYDLFCQRVRMMEEQGTVSYWSILFNAESFSDLLDRIADVDAVMAYDNEVMDQLIATREELERVQGELESARAEEQAAKEQQEAKKAEQQAKVAEAQALVDQINADTAEVNRQLDAESAAASEIQAEIAQKQKQLEEERKQNNIVISSETGYLWPLPGYYRLSSLFGYRIHPITGVAHSHTGIDIPASGGTPILAAKSGQVVTSAYHYSYGNYVVIDHGNGNSTLYAHMSSRAVSEGQMVTQGQVIGYVGTTGSSTGNHLHFEVRDNYTRVDPESKFPSLNLTPPW